MCNILQIDKQILDIDKVICRHISNTNNLTRGELSQDILPQLRHFVEHIMLKIYANGSDIEDTQDNVKQAVKYAKNQDSLRHLSRFHHFLQVSVSHRTLEEENSERLMLKYYEYLLRIKTLLHEKYSFDVLVNLEQFPIEIDESLNEYYFKIAQKVDGYKMKSTSGFRYDRFYIQNIKPFFCNNKIYYEVAFIPANDKASKTDRIIAFTEKEITDFYAVKLAIEDDSIEIFDKEMPIRIILDWEVSIRPCEFKNFSKLINNQAKAVGRAEERNLTRYLTETGRSLAEVVVFSDEAYSAVRNKIVPDTEAYHFFDLLDYCRGLIKSQAVGCNILRYLLHHMNNRVIKEQYHESYKKNYYTGRWEYLGGNNWISNLYLANECLPFDTMPFCSGLRKHVPSLSDLLIALDATDREHEFMARFIKNNTEQRGILYTKLEKVGEKYILGNFEDVEKLRKIYNQKLPNTRKQQARKLIIDKGYIFIEEYRDDTITIIKNIQRLARSGVDNYSNTAKHWIENTEYKISEEKKKALEKMFDKSHVSVIYGAAGTGKTTFINYISNFLKEYSKLYLAHTNPAVNNLRRKVAKTSDCEYMTISKFNNKYNGDIKREYDIIFMDECSTISNKEMKEFLELAKFKLLVLVGDTYQIEAIEFGNWFDVIGGFLPVTSICELVKPYRSNSAQLQALWDNVRKMEDDILDRLQAGGYSANLDPSILEPALENEIILCLSYGGLYGINNINHFMQENNKGKEISRGIQRYKVGDPILFNDAADSFFTKSKEQIPIIHNNMKGKIVDFRLLEAGKVTERIQFDIEIERPLMNLDNENVDFQVIGASDNGNSIIRFEVYKNKSSDEDDDNTSKSIVPFQIAYAVSIHKAQGLEYDSVKIIITDDIDELVTHSIFYTAITRARKKLKIYWSQSVEKKVLDRIEPKNNHQDISLLKQEIMKK
ncbi:MAG: AAA family ATPase [Lachnospiraceae bacterium]|nr:AAA family ATPase [Lachnospiraceae bacterium]